jgi:hypothetical protein
MSEISSTKKKSEIEYENSSSGEEEEYVDTSTPEETKRFKSKKILFFAVCVFLGVIGIILLIVYVAAWRYDDTYFPGGDGTSLDPFQIESCHHLQHINSFLSNNHFKIMKDIDCLETSEWNKNSKTGIAEGFVSLGNDEDYFTGKLDGNGKTISNLYLNHHMAALFAYTSEADISHLNIKDPVYYGETIGGLIAESAGTRVTRVNIIGFKPVFSQDVHMQVGGGLIAHDINSVVTLCDVEIRVSCNQVASAGGLIGSASGTRVDQSAASGFIYTNNTNDVGGLIGVAANVHISESKSTVFLNGPKHVGGLIGVLNLISNKKSEILSSQASSQIIGNQAVGGLIGAIYDNGAKGSLAIISSTTNGVVIGISKSPISDIGGAIGKVYCTNPETSLLFDTLNTLSLLQVANFHLPPENIGGLIGSLHATTFTLKHCISSIDVSANTAHSVGGLIGKLKTQKEISPEAQFLSANTRLSERFNSRSRDSKRQVSEDEDLWRIEECSSTKVVIGDDEIGGFIGRIDSQAKGIIKFCSSTSAVTGKTNTGGLIGVANSLIFKNLVIEDCSSSGPILFLQNHSNIGGAIGSGTNLHLHYVSSESSMSGLSKLKKGKNAKGGGVMGGLVGSMTGGLVEKSMSIGELRQTNSNIVGGLIGLCNSCTVSNTYSRSPVEGNHAVAGLVGFGYGSILNSYATGFVHASAGDYGGLIAVKEGEQSAQNCFWDIQTTGVKISQGGEGKLTEDMKKKEIYVGWDFQNVWQIDEGKDYPILTHN